MIAPLLQSAAASREAWRREAARLPVTMQPGLNQQISGWDDLFPFEQKRTAEFLRGVSLFQQAELDALTQPLRELEARMGVSRWNFSTQSDTMENASQLARSPFYAAWREEVQRVFSAIAKKAGDSARPEPPRGRLILLVLPASLPISSIVAHKPWDPRGAEFPISGDPRRIIELALRGPSSLTSLLASQSLASQDGANPDVAGADCWLIDADATLGTHLGSMDAGSTDAPPASILQYSVLKDFRDQFLAQVNTVPKDIEATDQVLARMRSQNWETWWPASMAGQGRLRNFVVELFLSGNGALIFSNAFLQWAASEALRRARPRLLVGRFGLRSKPKPFTSIAIFENQQKISAMQDVDDPEGSALDALTLARYVWLSTERYPEREHTGFVCVSESSGSAYVIAPESSQPDWPAGRPVAPQEIHDWMRRALA
jgi:hypothetical protein